MTVEVEALDPAAADDGGETPRCRVTTVNAASRERIYEITLTPEGTLPGATVLEGKRVDDDAPDEPAGGGVPQRAFDAAREHFVARGIVAPEGGRAQ